MLEHVVSARIAAFVQEVELQLRTETVAMVEAALRTATTPFISRPVTTRSPYDARVVAHVRSHPGLRTEELVRALAIPSTALKPRLAFLVASKKLRREGRTRGTTYFLV